MKLYKQVLAVMAVSLISISTSLWAENPPAAPAAAPDASKAVAGVQVPEGSVEVVRMVLCRDVKDREPDQEITSAAVGDVVVGWTQIRSGVGEVTVTHRWLHEAENVGDVPLAVKSSPWRTWSRKTLSDPGNWKWQVLDPSGSVIKEVAFTVTSAASAAPATEPTSPK